MQYSVLIEVCNSDSTEATMGIKRVVLGSTGIYILQQGDARSKKKKSSEVHTTSRLTCANFGPVRGGQVRGEEAGERPGLQGGILLVSDLHGMCQKHICWWWVVGQKWQTSNYCGGGSGR